MKEFRRLLKLNLRLFEGEGAGAGASLGSEGEGTATEGEATKTPSAAKVGKQERNANPLADVQYGIQDEVQETNVEANTDKPAVLEKTLDERKAEFEKLIKSDYKDIYTGLTQDMINKRFGETKGMQSQLDSMNPMLEMLATKYGVDAKDLESLSKAITEDESFYEDEAMEKGVTVIQLKEMKSMERENKAFHEEKAQTAKDEGARQIYEKWSQEGEALKQVYPNFDFDAECENKDFTDMITAGVGVEHAYKVAHMDELMSGALQFTAQQIQQKVINGIKTRGNRPAENGNSSQAAAVTKKDVSQLTKKDMDEIDRRAARGEKIRF